MHLPVKLVTVTTAVGRVLYKNAPKIMVVAGTVTSIAAVVEGIKATPKAIEILNEHKEMVEKFKEAKEEHSENNEYTEKDYKKDMAYQYIRTIGKLGMNYSKAIALEGLSLSLFFGAAHLYEKKVKVLTSTLIATADAAMSDRQKVYDALGQEEADKIFGGLKDEVYEEEVTDEKGKKKMVQKKRIVADPSNNDICSFLWTERDENWDPIPEYREMHILDVANTLGWRVFGEQDEFGNYKRKPVKNARVSMNDIRKWFFSPETYWREECQVAGYTIDNPDGKIIPRWTYVSVPDPDNPKYFIDGMRISWNIAGSICPSIIR